MISVVDKTKPAPPVNSSMSDVPAASDHSKNNAVWPWTAHAASQEIPSRCDISCRILEWPIFDEIQYDRTGDILFVERTTASQQSHLSHLRPQGIIEEHIPSYVDQFLINVHTKNPVVDHTMLSQHVRNIAENGLGWDGPTSVTVSEYIHAIVCYPRTNTSSAHGLCVGYYFSTLPANFRDEREDRRTRSSSGGCLLYRRPKAYRST